MSRLFISYSSRDRDRIRPLVAALEARGHEVWWDGKIGGAARFSAEIAAALDDAEIAIVAWSQASIQSEWVLDEAAHARDHGKFVPIRLDDILPPLGFRQRQAIDFTNWDGSSEREIDELETALRRIKKGAIGEYNAESRTIIHQHHGAFSKKTLLLAFGALLLVAAGGFYFWQDHLSQVEARSLKQNPDENIVAILPFDAANGTTSDDPLVAGVYEGLVRKLSKVEGLTILSPLALAKYAGEVPSLEEIANATGARYVMQGDVARLGEDLRVSLQLADASRGTNLWASDLQRSASLSAIEELQSEAAEIIARELKAALDEDERARIETPLTNSREAYEQYLVGAGILESDPNPMRFVERRIAAMEKATELDPEFGEAHAGLAILQMMNFRMAAAMSPQDREALRIAITRSLQRARYLDAESAETVLAEGYYNLWVTNNYDKAEPLLERAMKLAPSYQIAAFGYGWAARRNGRFDESVAALERAAKLDPFAYQPMRDLSWSLAALGRFEEAWDYAERARAIAPAPASQASHEARLHLLEGDPQKAVESFANVPPGQDPLSHLIHTEAAIASGDRAAIRASLEAWPQRFREGGPLAIAYQVRQAQAAERLNDTSALEEARERLTAISDGQEGAPVGMWGTPVAPVTVPAFLGDRDEVDRLVAEYDERDDVDHWVEVVNDRRLIAEAYARLGAKARALDQLALITEELGPVAFLSFMNDPAFSSLRFNQEWRTMQANARQQL